MGLYHTASPQPTISSTPCESYFSHDMQLAASTSIASLTGKTSFSGIQQTRPRAPFAPASETMDSHVSHPGIQVSSRKSWVDGEQAPSKSEFRQSTTRRRPGSTAE